MTDYNLLKAQCEKITRVGASTIDDYLIYYAAEQDKVAKEMDTRLAHYKHVVRDLQPEWVRMFKSQYIAHRIFRENGYVHKYLNHSAVKLLGAPQLAYLTEQAKRPWSFRFCVVMGNPEPDFYQMRDVFTGQEFLLYSQGMTKGLASGPALLWFTLMADNGLCYQTFGPILQFRSFEPDDIFFFATELHPKIENAEDLVRDVQENPVPYMMLISGSTLPLTEHQGVRIIQNQAEYDCEFLDPELLKNDFIITRKGDLIRAELKNWETYPHFSTMYFDGAKKILRLQALSDVGYKKLVDTLHAHGHVFGPEPDIRVGMSMLSCCQTILKKKIQTDEYASVFTPPPSPASQKQIDELNQLAGLILPDINAGKVPDYAALSLKTGVAEDSIRELGTQLIAQFDKMTRKPG